MDPITIIAGLVSVVPHILSLFGASQNATAAVQAVSDIATTVTGIADPAAALQAVQASPDFQKAMNEHIQAMGAQDVQSIQAVNATMQAEATTPKGSWRTACGWVVALGSFVTLMFTLYLFWQAMMQGNAQALNIIPGLTLAMTTILAVPGAAVGIVAYHEGRVNQINASQP